MHRVPRTKREVPYALIQNIIKESWTQLGRHNPEAPIFRSSSFSHGSSQYTPHYKNAPTSIDKSSYTECNFMYTANMQTFVPTMELLMRKCKHTQEASLVLISVSTEKSTTLTSMSTEDQYHLLNIANTYFLNSWCFGTILNTLKACPL